MPVKTLDSSNGYERRVGNRISLPFGKTVLQHQSNVYQVEDISPGGLGLVGKVPMVVGQQIALTLGKTCDFDLLVRSCTPLGPSGESAGFGLGCQFIDQPFELALHELLRDHYFSGVIDDLFFGLLGEQPGWEFVKDKRSHERIDLEHLGLSVQWGSRPASVVNVSLAGIALLVELPRASKEICGLKLAGLPSVALSTIYCQPLAADDLRGAGQTLLGARFLVPAEGAVYSEALRAVYLGLPNVGRNSPTHYELDAS